MTAIDALAILEQIEDAVVVIDAGGAVVFVNAAAGRLLGAPHIGRSFLDVLPTAARADFAGPLASPGAAADFQTRGFGDGVTLGVRLRPTGPHAAILLRDVSHRADADRGKDLFLGALSHELRTPLAPVLMAVSSIEGDPSLPERVRDDLAMIRRNIEFEVRLIDDLLDLNRVLHNRLPLQRENASLHRLLKSAAESSSVEARDKQIRLQFDLGATRDVVHADAARVQQVLLTLVRNAIKFSGVGGEIELCTLNPSSESIELVCRDEGIGVPADVLPKLFSAFEAGDSAASRKFGGIGLGLAVGRAVIDLHGGALTATSGGTGRGSSFVVRLPLAPVGASAAPAPKPAATAASAGTLKLLLVEDHEDTARVLRRLLSMRGYDVRLAASATAAFAAAEAEAFDLVISDIGLPDGNGYDLMRRLRAKGFDAGIAMTGYGREEDVAASRAAGFAAHVVKPVDLQQLVRTIQSVIAQRKSQPRGDLQNASA
ncbi:MAG TPA: ATP-binding protein [Tepidisphaeraceae bacterium]|jgi:two-component system CheB/CheR fusion protein